MTTTNTKVKGNASVAALKNVTATTVMLRTLIERAPTLPGLGVLSGPSGFGKSTAAQFCQNRFGGIYIEARDYWSRKTFCEQLLTELGGRPRGTIATMMGEIIAILGDDPNRPLIIDEADKLIDIRAIELVRDIFETTQVPILMIGEERLPAKLQPFERVHNRVLEWLLAEPCDIDDTRALAGIVCRGLTIGDDLLDAVRAKTYGRARRIVTTLHRIGDFARNSGLKEVDAATYQGRIETGEIPHRAGRVD